MDVGYYRNYLEFAHGVPFSDGNEVEPLQNGDAIFSSMLSAIRDAQHCIEFLTFVYWSGDIAIEFAQALAAKAEEGLQVRILLDAYGAKSMPSDARSIIEQSPAVVRWFRPMGTIRVWRIDKRTHRKILSVDDRVGFTGGVGIAQEWCGDARNSSEWRDSHFRFTGPSIAGLKAAFLDNWNEAGAWEMKAPEPVQTASTDGIPVQIIRSSSTVEWTEVATLMRALVTVAQTHIAIVTPYFVPDQTLVKLLCDAASRGVSIEIMLPGEHCDERLPQLAGYASIATLLRAGVKIYRYEKTNLHAKIIVVDGLVSCLGSANLNHRSMGKDEECSAVALSSSLADHLLAAFSKDKSDSQTLDITRWEARPMRWRVLEWLAKRVVEQL